MLAMDSAGIITHTDDVIDERIAEGPVQLDGFIGQDILQRDKIR